MMRRRELLAGRDDLPAGYRRCKYLRGTGTTRVYTGAYIDTGIPSTSNTKVEIVVKKGDLKYYDRFYGINKAGYRGVWIMRKDRLENHFCYANNKMIGSIDLGYDVHTVTFDGGSVYLDGDLMLTYNGEEFSTDDSAWLFAVNGGDIRCDDYIYACKTWHFGVPIQNLIPCLDKNGTPCMYDTVTKKTLYSPIGTFLYELA